MSERFDASIKRGHQIVLSSVMGRMQAGATVVLAPQEFADLSDLAGALNFYASEPALPVVIAPEFVDGAPRYVFTSMADQIVAIPFTIQPPPYPQTSMFSASAAEYGTGGTGFARAAISRTAGDMVGLGWVISGSNATIDLDALVVGSGLFYYNHRMEPGHGPRGTGFSVNFTK